MNDLLDTPVESTTRALLDFEECYDAVIELCEEAREAVYLSSWLIDFDYRMNGRFTMRELLERMSARGVVVKILLTPNVLFDLVPPEVLPEGVELRFATTWGPRYRLFERLSFGRNVRSNPADYDYRWFSTHHKLLVVDGRRALIGGCDINDQRAGSERTGETNDHGFIWAETAVLTECDAELWHYCAENFETRGRAQMDSVRWLGPFPTRSHEASVLCHQIRDARELLYIENQYLTVGSRTEPNVLEVLAERIARAARTAESLRIVIVTNRVCADSGGFLRFALKQNFCLAIEKLEQHLERRGIPKEKLKDHLVCAELRRDEAPIFVHSKVFIRDGETLITSSSNLNDRSLSSSGSDQELGVRFDDRELAFDLLQRLIAKHLGRPASAEPLSGEEIFEAVRSSQGHFRALPPERVGWATRLWYRIVTAFAPSLR
ncbi:MAG: phosphatidylserine/phosphatidylglycerophosphate/cardiolipin synthase family protein [Planctomycetota bacterium]